MNHGMANEIFIQRGDTFLANGLYTDANDNPVDLVTGNITVESYVKDRNGWERNLTVTVGGTIGTYEITAPTDDWPLGRVTWHVRYSQDGIKKSTETVVINVEDA